MTTDQELDLLKEYMQVYIQLLPYSVGCGGKKLWMSQLPTFDYFKNTYNNPDYSLAKPRFKESKAIYKPNLIAHVYTHGLGTGNGIGYRLYSTWMGCKYFTGNNMEGNFTVDAEAVNKGLKLT